jgi:hypothetical protein
VWCDADAAGCSPIQQRFGETPVATLHFICAAAFIGSLAVISFLFAKRDVTRRRPWTPPGDEVPLRQDLDDPVRLLRRHRGSDRGGHRRQRPEIYVWELTPLHIGEVAAVWAFGCAWFLKSRDLWSAIGHGVEVPDTLKRKEVTR